MKLINIGVAGCLGRMGQELVKEITNNQNINFSGGFEDPKHEKINTKISDLIDINTSHIVSNNPKKIFEESDVVIDFTTPKSCSIFFLSDSGIFFPCSFKFFSV